MNKDNKIGSLDNFNFTIEINSLVEKENAPKTIRDQIPDGAMFFKGIASNGDLNRNGYIIRAKAWKFGNFLQDFLDHGKILFQHNDDKPLGKPLTAKVVKDDLLMSGFVFDTHSNGDIGRGLITSLSTGHITHEVEFENISTKEIMSEDDFWDHEDHLKMYFGDEWKMAVTKAELVETSFVTIPSNRKSHIINKNYLINKSGLSEDELNNLYLNNSNMKLSKEELAAAKAAQNAIEAKKDKAPDDGSNNTDTPEVSVNGVVLSDENALEVVEFMQNGTKKEKVEVKLDSNKVEELITSAIEIAVKKVEENFTKEINKLRGDKKEDLATIVKNNSEDPKKEGDSEGVEENDFKGL